MFENKQTTPRIPQGVDPLKIGLEFVIRVERTSGDGSIESPHIRVYQYYSINGDLIGTKPI